MVLYEAKMQHDESSFEALAHMQYNIFCGRNKVSRTILSGIFVLIGVVNFSEWWGILVAAYGCYLTTSTYSSANHTAHKLAKQITDAGMPFPSTRYLFKDDCIEIITPADSDEDGQELYYADIRRIAEDMQNCYIFISERSGYMFPKEQLGEKMTDLRHFLEMKTGQKFYCRTAPVFRMLMRKYN